MARAHFLQTSFHGGEWGAQARGRMDLPEYTQALKSVENYLVLEAGGLMRRPGTVHVAHSKTPGEGVRLIYFPWTADSNHILQFGDGYMRVFLNNVRVMGTARTVSSISSANPALVTTSTSHGWSTGDRVVFSSVTDSAVRQYFENREFEITVTAVDQFTIPVNGSSPDITTFSGTVARIQVSTTPYADEDLVRLAHAQSDTAMYLFHPSYQPRKLVFAGVTSWTLSTVDFEDGPYLDENETSTTMTPSAVSGSITLTASAITGINSDTGFQTTDVGRVIRLQDNAENWTWGRITARASTTSVTVLILGDALANTTATTSWRLGLYSDTDGWPAAGVFHDGRLYLVGEAQENRVDGSVTFEPANFSPTAADGTTADALAVSFQLNTETNALTKWLASRAEGLLIGTSGGTWLIDSVDGGTITTTTINARPLSAVGSCVFQPAVADSDLLFIHRSKRAIYTLQAAGQPVRGYHDNLTAMVPEKFPVTIWKILYQERPVPYLWALLSNGALMGGRFRSTPQGPVIAWTTHTFGTSGLAKSIALAPTIDGLSQTLWVCVQRTADSQAYMSIEYMTPLFDDSLTATRGTFVEGCLQYDSTNHGSTRLWWESDPSTRTYTFTGLWNREGSTVEVHAAGLKIGTAVVASGQITIVFPTYVDAIAATDYVRVGAPRANDHFTLLRRNDGAVLGQGLGSLRRVDQFTTYVYRTGQFSIGGDSTLTHLHQPSAAHSALPTLYSRVYTGPLRARHDYDGEIHVSQAGADPGLFLAVGGYQKIEQG